MPHTPFCDLLDIETPIVQAAIWPAASPDLVAAVSNAGAVGSVAAVFGSADVVRAQIERVRELTDRPFVVNHVVPQLDEDAFEVTLSERPAAISFALGDPEDLVERARVSGAKVIEQVHTVAQARAAAERGVDAVIAQGSEAGGQGMSAGVGTLSLIPQVVDAVDPIPVLAAGGIADGRGLAAAIVLGGAGVNAGTRFLASEEAGADPQWKRRITEIESEEAVRFEAWRSIMPRSEGGYDVVPRVIRTDFVAEAEAESEQDSGRSKSRRQQIMDAIKGGRAHELTPFTGQTAGQVEEVMPAAEIVARMTSEADAVLSSR